MREVTNIVREGTNIVREGTNSGGRGQPSNLLLLECMGGGTESLATDRCMVASFMHISAHT